MMKSLDQLKNETAEELNYWGYREFKDLLEQGLLTPESVEEFMERYATNRVKEVENYYKTQDEYER